MAIEDIEILVAGGGPAGLLVASLLAQHFQVAVVESGVIGHTNKYWVTTSQRLALHGLDTCVRTQPCRATFGTFLGGFAAAKGDFAVTAEEDILRLLADRCRKAGVTVHEKSAAEAVHWEDDRIVTATTAGEFRSRLLIDATGGGSKIAATFRHRSIDGFFTVYGERVDDVMLRNTDIAGGHILRLGQPPVILEVIPISNTSVYCAVFTVTQEAQRFEVLASALETYVQRNPFFIWTKASRKPGIAKFGAIPIGVALHKQTARAIAFGEAGMMQSPLFGGAFNEALAYAHHFAGQVEAGMKKGREGNRNWRVRYPLRKRINDSLQRSLVLSLIDGSTPRLEHLVKLLSHLGERRACRFFLGELSMREVLPTMLAALPLFRRSEPY